MQPGNVVVLVSLAAVSALVALMGAAAAPPRQPAPARADVPASATSQLTFVRVIDGVRFTVLDLHQGVTFRAATLQAGMTPDQASAFERPGQLPTPYVSITLLIEPAPASPADPLSFDNPTWGAPMELQPDGSRTTPVQHVAFASQTLHPGVTRPPTNDPFVLPEVSTPAEVKSIRIYGPARPAGPARFSVGLSRAGTPVGTLVFDNLPLK